MGNDAAQGKVNAKVRGSQHGGKASRTPVEPVKKADKGKAKAAPSGGRKIKTFKGGRSLEKLPPLYTEFDFTRPGSDQDTESWRSPFRRDYARVIHSPAFRRLQGKTQLFPGNESDFFRNRLTHSLEVAQIAESIAHRINDQNEYFSRNQIDPKLCATASLMHDLGHPPFGHNGEKALDDCMKEFGGFEGNAQTLRIVTKLEKKSWSPGLSIDDPSGRMGLGISHRAIASILKYDREIPGQRTDEDSIVKGYYADDRNIIDKIKLGMNYSSETFFKTIECQIMDIADDIAYSTYDLEDTLKAGFLSPAEIISSSEDLLHRVAIKVNRDEKSKISITDVLEVFIDIFSGLHISAADDSGDDNNFGLNIAKAFRISKNICENGYARTKLTSQLVGEFINSVGVQLNEKQPSFSEITVDPGSKRKIETLKHFTYEATIESPRLKLAEYRGYDIVFGIFDALSSPRGHLLLPQDTRDLYSYFENNASLRMRTICDFVAGMTDRYAIEFYGRLHSDNPQSIFKPA